MQKPVYGLDDLLELCTVRLWSPHKQKFGTGFFVAPRLIATCAHVTGEKSAAIQTLDVSWGGKSLSATLLRLFPDPCPPDQIFPDIALLELSEHVEHPFVLIEPGYSKGDPISSWGFSDLRPAGESIYGSCEGTAKYDASPESHLIKFKETQIRPGISGAPLLNERTGAVCGMIKRTRNSDSDTGGLAVRGELLLSVLDEYLRVPLLRREQPTSWLDARAATDKSFQQYIATLKGYTSSAYRALPLPNGMGIDDVYVPLRLRSLDPSFIKGTFALHDLFRNLTFSPKGQNVLIEASPGAGKSTLLRYIAHNSFDHPSAIGLEQRRIPLLLRLQSIAATTGTTIEDRIFAAIAHAGDYHLQQRPKVGFFESWPGSFGAKWLLLLDGFDEVSKDSRAGVMQFTKQLEAAGCELFVTTRPTESMGNTYSSSFNRYSIESFTPDQQHELAGKWFGSEAPEFRTSIQATGNEFLGTTPLLLTVAASVFSDQHHLPSRRTELYETFIDCWWREATSRSVCAELGGYFETSPFAALQTVARLMTENDYSSQVAGVVDAFTTILAPQVTRPPDYVRPQVEAFIDLMGRRSGVFIVRGKTCEWLHRSFREYLCAKSFAQLHPDSAEALSIARHWRDDQWRQIILFCVSFWSERHSVASLLRRIAKLNVPQSGNQNVVASPYGLVFAADCIAEGAIVDAETQREIIKYLCREALVNSEGTICNRLLAGITDDSIKRADETLRALLALKHLPTSEPNFSQLVKTMVSFAREWRETMGNAAATDLAALGCRTELLEIAKDKRLDQGIRYQAARDLLKKVGRDEAAIDALYEQALEQRNTASVTTRIVDALGESGSSDRLLMLVRLDSLDLAVRIHVAEVLDEYAMLDALRSVKNDRKMDPAVRERAFWGLIGKTSGSESVSLIDELISTLERVPGNGERLVGVLAGAKNWDGLIRVLEHSKAQEAVREIAISRLISEKRIEELRHLVESINLPLQLRQMAAEGLRQRGSPEEEKERLLRFYSQHLEYSPGNARVLRERSQLFLSVGEYPNAIKDFSLLIEQDGNDEVSLGYRGNALRLSRSYTDAIADFDRALAIDPDDAWHLMRRGLSKWELGRWAEASSDFVRAFELGSTEDKYYAHYADCLCELEKYEDAFAIACKAVNVDFMTAMPYAVRGSIYSATGRWEEAALDFSQALLLSSEYKWALRQRAMAYRCSQKFALCIDDLNHLLNLSEDDRSARFERCEVSLRMGDYVTAAQDLALLSYDREKKGWLLYLHWLAQQVKGRNNESDGDLRELRKDLESRWAKGELGEYEQSNLAIYQVAEGQSERARQIYNRMICEGKHRFLAQTALPELIDLVTIVPSVADVRELYDEVSQQIMVVQQKYELKGGVEVPNGRLNPMYCRKAYISGLWDEKERADRLLARHADRRRTIVIWRLEDDWVYGQCNFKHSPEDEYTFKFVDHLETVLKRDLEMFIAANLQRILFVDNELRQAFETNTDMDLDSYLLNYDLIEDEEASKIDGIS